jgi:hypothetical protein
MSVSQPGRSSSEGQGTTDHIRIRIVSISKDLQRKVFSVMSVDVDGGDLWVRPEIPPRAFLFTLLISTHRAAASSSAPSATRSGRPSITYDLPVLAASGAGMTSLLSTMVTSYPPFLNIHCAVEIPKMPDPTMTTRRGLEVDAEDNMFAREWNDLPAVREESCA